VQSIPKGPNLNLELVLIRKVLNVYQKLINRKTSVRTLTRENDKMRKRKAIKVIFSPTPVLSSPSPSLPGRPGRAPYPPSEARRPFSCPFQTRALNHTRYTTPRSSEASEHTSVLLLSTLPLQNLADPSPAPPSLSITLGTLS